MAWAAALGSIVGGGSEGMASAAQYQASKHERNVAWRRQQAWELMAPGLRMEGLRRAGLNPILAATQGMTGGPGHIATATTGGSPRFDQDSVGRAISSAKQAKMMANAVEIQALQKEQEREKVMQEGERTEQMRVDTSVKRNFAVSMAEAELLNLMAQRGLTSARHAESLETKARIMVDRTLMEMGIPGARAMEEMYEKYPFLRQLREFSGGSLGPAAIGAGAATIMRGRGERSKRGKRR